MYSKKVGFCKQYGIIEYMNTVNNKKDKVLEIIDSVVCFVSAGIFAFCLVGAIVCMCIGKESPINGYGLYRPIEILQRLGGLAAVMLTFVIKKIGVKLPPYVTILYNIFVVLTVFGGTIMGLYINTDWWDKFNHTISGVLLGVAGMFFVNSLTEDSQKVNGFSVFITVFSVALMCGAVWEIYEYTCDGIFGLNMQKFMNDLSGEMYIGHEALKDTMGDITVDALGGLISGIVCAILSVKNIDFVRKFKVSYQPKRARKIAGNPVVETGEPLTENVNMTESTENADE